MKISICGQSVILEGHPHDETKFQQFLLKPGCTETKPFNALFVIGKEGGRMPSNAAHRYGMSHLEYILYGCGNNKFKKHNKHIYSICRSKDAVKVHFINQPIFNQCSYVQNPDKYIILELQMKLSEISLYVYNSYK